LQNPALKCILAFLNTLTMGTAPTRFPSKWALPYRLLQLIMVLSIEEIKFYCHVYGICNKTEIHIRYRNTVQFYTWVISSPPRWRYAVLQRYNIVNLRMAWKRCRIIYTSRNTRSANNLGFRIFKFLHFNPLFVINVYLQHGAVHSSVQWRRCFSRVGLALQIGPG